MKKEQPVFTMDKHIVLNPSLTLAEKGLIALISAFDERGISTEEIKMYCPLDDCEAILESALKKVNDYIERED